MNNDIKVLLQKLPDDKKDLIDHADFFCIEACFKLYRMLPRQTEKLARQWYKQGNYLYIYLFVYP